MGQPRAGVGDLSQWGAGLACDKSAGGVWRGGQRWVLDNETSESMQKRDGYIKKNLPIPFVKHDMAKPHLSPRQFINPDKVDIFNFDESIRVSKTPRPCQPHLT